LERVKGIEPSSEAWEECEIGKNPADLLASGEFYLIFRINLYHKATVWRPSSSGVQIDAEGHRMSPVEAG
jgi:hypothetical protein